MSGMKQRVVVVGASPKPDRYSNRAVALLLEHGHEVVPVHPSATAVHGIPVVRRIADVGGHVDTVTMYVSRAISDSVAEDLLTLRPARVIFNPDSENPDLQQALEHGGIATLEACTLVLLNTGQFDSNRQ